MLTSLSLCPTFLPPTLSMFPPTSSFCLSPPRRAFPLLSLLSSPLLFPQDPPFLHLQRVNNHLLVSPRARNDAMAGLVERKRRNAFIHAY